MGNIFKVIIAILTILFSLGLIVTGIIFQDMALYKQQQLQELYAKRDDLSVQSQKIDALVADLITTIDQQNQINTQLSNKIDQLSAMQGNVSSIGNSVSKPTQITPITQPAPTPAPTPAPVVTRAS